MRYTLTSLLALGQGAYFLLTGIWSLVHIRSFVAVTGPKTDVWLVKTVGVLVAVIGATLIWAGRNILVTSEIVILALGSAIGLAAIDIIYVKRRRISKIYLADAVAELLLAAGWIFCVVRGY